MSGYVSQPGGLYGSGVYPDSRPQISYGPIFDALTSGATSLLHNQILRQQNSNDLAMRRSELAFRQKEADDRSRDQERDFGLKQQTERHRFIEAGGIPEHDESQQVAGTAPIGAVNPPSPIQSAMTPGGMPGVQVTPSNAPGSVAPAVGPTSTTMYHPEATTAPESYDPAKAGTYQRGVAVQQLRNDGFATRDEHRQEFQAEQQAKRLAAQQAGRAYSAQAAKELAAYRAKLGTAKGTVARAMTGNSLEAANEKVAAGYLETFGGNLNDAVAALDSPDGAELRKQGVTRNHLLAAFGKSNATATNQAVRFQLGPDAVDPNAAAGKVGATRAAVGRLGKQKEAEPATPTPAFELPNPFPDAAAPKPMGGGGGGGGSGTPPSGRSTTATKNGTTTAAPADDFSDDEVLAAYKAGKKSDADIAAWIREQRKSKKGGK